MQPTTIVLGLAAATLSSLAAAQAQPLAIAPGAQAAFTAECRKSTLAANPKAAPWVDDHCKESWAKVVAAAPIADALLAAVPANAGEAITVPALQARLKQVRWGTKPARGMAASGTLGKLTAAVAGGASADTLSFGWQATGAEVPFDTEGALRARGVRLDPVGCLAFGAGEVTRAYVATAPGRAPFSLTVAMRGAPTANAMSSYSASADLHGRLPTLAGLRTRDMDTGWSEKCPL